MPKIKIEDATVDLKVSWLSERGTPNVETVTMTVAAESQIETITVPDTASAAQGDYIVVYTAAGTAVAVWLDIDDNGTAPTGAAYVASDYQVEVNIATGGSAATNATALATALGLEVNYTDVTIADNLDGTVTLTQDVLAACSNAAPHNTDDSGVGSITVSLDNDGVTGHQQADYIVLSNKAGEKLACWVNIDSNGTEPTGAKYVAADYTEEVAINSGDNAATNGTALYNAIIGSLWSAAVTIVDNEDGTIKLTQASGGVVAAADPENSDDTGVGTITASTDTIGTDNDAKMIVYVPKSGLKIAQNNTTNTFSIQSLHEDVIIGDSLINMPYLGLDGSKTVVLPTSTSLGDLVSQIVALKNNV